MGWAIRTCETSARDPPVCVCGGGGGECVRMCVVGCDVLSVAGEGGGGNNNNLILSRSAPIAIFCLVTETKGQTFRGIPGFYSTSGTTAVAFTAHLVAVKCGVFTTTR